MLQRGGAAKYAKHVFFKSFNDLDVFVEDTASESRKIYVEILRRAFGADIQISQVFPIGTKSRVIDRCANDQGVRARRAVYIIDGDYDILLGKALPKLIRLYRLKRYCIENYLIEEGAIISVLDEEIPDLDSGAIRARLDFAGWLSSISGHLFEFVIGSSVGFSRNCGCATINVPLASLGTDAEGRLEHAKVLSKIAEFRMHTDKQHGAGTFDADCKLIRDSIVDDEVAFVTKYLSGKSTLLPLVRRRLDALFNKTPSHLSFKLRLAMRCNVAELSEINDIAV